MKKDTPLRFSDRLPKEFEPNPLTAMLQSKRERGHSIVDWSMSNPTHCAFSSIDGLQGRTAWKDALPYRASAQGDASVREQVAKAWRPMARIDPQGIFLTSSTSEAYSVLIRTFCNPGDEVLIPRPGYPLLEHISRADAVTPISYSLMHADGWMLDFDELEKSVTDRTRMLIVVHPNNPTGSYLTASEMRALDAWCDRYRVILVADEVFFEYPWSRTRPRESFCELPPRAQPRFVLGGLSKFLGMPQWKLSWIHQVGGDTRTQEALLWILDLYLSVSGLSAAGTGALLEQSEAIQVEILERLRANAKRLREGLQGNPGFSFQEQDAGWSATLRIHHGISDAHACLVLLDRQGIYAQPGEWFDMPFSSMVVSLLLPQETFEAALSGLKSFSPLKS